MNLVFSLNHCSVATALVNTCVCMFLHVCTNVRLYARKVDSPPSPLAQSPVSEAAELIEPHFLSLVRLPFFPSFTQFVSSSYKYACFLYFLFYPTQHNPAHFLSDHMWKGHNCPRDQAWWKAVQGYFQSHRQFKKAEVFLSLCLVTFEHFTNWAVMAGVLSSR